MSENDEEFRKTLLPVTKDGSNYIFIDNLNRVAKTGHLPALITAGTITDRILGQSEMVTVPVKSAIILAGNNCRFTREMMRRIMPIRLDASINDPANTRGVKDFKHMPYHKWVMANRADLIWACLVLIKNWVNMGMPRSKVVMNSFDDFSAIMGGILEAAGIPGFLSNVPAYMSSDEGDGEGESDLPLFDHLWRTYGDGAEFSAAELYSKIYNTSFNTWTVSVNAQGGTDQARMISLGKILSTRVGVVFALNDDTKVRLGKRHTNAGSKYHISRT
jgi:hypothetical protein